PQPPASRPLVPSSIRLERVRATNDIGLAAATWPSSAREAAKDTNLADARPVTLPDLRTDRTHVDLDDDAEIENVSERTPRNGGELVVAEGDEGTGDFLGDAAEGVEAAGCRIDDPLVTGCSRRNNGEKQHDDDGGGDRRCRVSHRYSPMAHPIAQSMTTTFGGSRLCPEKAGAVVHPPPPPTEAAQPGEKRRYSQKNNRGREPTLRSPHAAMSQLML